MAHYSEDNQHSDGRDSEASYTPKNKSTVPTAKEVGEGLHTPGEWVKQDGSFQIGGHTFIAIVNDDYYPVAYTLIGSKIDRKEAYANAKLIASAPQLHADNKALRKVLERVVGMSDDAYLTGHPEFVSIADEAKEILNRLNK